MRGRERTLIDAMLLAGAIIALGAIVYSGLAWRAQAVEYQRVLMGHGLYEEAGR